MNQLTINKEITIKSKALHSGKFINLTLKPLLANSGIIFKRVDLAEDNIILANYKNVRSTTLCTEISNNKGAKVATIEHLMAAFFFLGIDNIMVEVDGSELPAKDGSANGFIEAILKVGLKDLHISKKVLEILKPVHIKNDNWELSIKPADKFIVNGRISFNHKFIGEQSYTYKNGEYEYSSDISKAKTFGFLKDVEFLHKQGIGLGASKENTNILTDEGLLDGCSLNYNNEFIKHKILDLCGDLYLSGYFIKGEVTAFKPGHLANNCLLKAIFSNKENYNVRYPSKAFVLKYSKGKDDRVFPY